MFFPTPELPGSGYSAHTTRHHGYNLSLQTRKHPDWPRDQHSGGDVKVETLALRRNGGQAKLWPMERPKFYHNPRCSKSRQVLQILEESGIEFDEIRYLEDPPSVSELRAILKLLKGDVDSMIRSKEAAYEELGLAALDGDVDQILAAVTEAPILLERPIVVWTDRAVIGRPPERVSEVLEEIG